MPSLSLGSSWTLFGAMQRGASGELEIAFSGPQPGRLIEVGHCSNNNVGNQLAEFGIEMRCFQLTDGLQALDARPCPWTSRSSKGHEALQLGVTRVDH